MKKILLLVLSLCATQLIFSQILPSPFSVKKLKGSFTINQNTVISTDEIGRSSANFLAEQLRSVSEGTFSVLHESQENGIQFKLDKNVVLNDEGYQLSIKESTIEIKARSERGMFYAVQSLLQLMPVAVFGTEKIGDLKWEIPCQIIADYPKYTFRSFMLDSGRQYQSPEFIKKYIDYLAMLKFNVFHWHLTEGQGWRIEIKKYPKLTEIGSKVAKGAEQQGYYTQEEIKDIVAYAEKRHITIVPEIDVPGHSEAALTAYPELTCLGKAPESVMAFTSHIFCGGNEKTYEFLMDVIDEVCALFPGEYIHLGGDEAPKKQWDVCEKCQGKIKTEQLKNSHELQTYFSIQLANYLKKKNKKVIFWGDVIHNDWDKNMDKNTGLSLPDNVVIHWWNYRRHKNLTMKKAIEKGYKVIANTNYYTYLNFPTTPWSKYAKNRTFDLKTVYEENPSDVATPNELIIGMGTCLWTDWYVQQHMIDKRVFPRVFALIEQMWNAGERKKFDDFYAVVKSKYPWLKSLGIDYGPAMTHETPANYNWE